MTTEAKNLLTAVLTATVIAGVSCKKNHPPDVPADPTGPSVCLRDSTRTFTATATDPDGDSVAVRFSWGDSTESSWTSWLASGGTGALTHAWSDTGTYLVCAQTQDPKGLASGWSGALSVRVVYRRPPQTPGAPTGPVIGGSDSVYYFAAAAFHPDNINVAIRFLWGNGTMSGWSPYVASGETVKMGNLWHTPGTYSVWAQAEDTADMPSGWSDPHAILIRPKDTLSKWRFQLAAGENISLYSSPAIGPDGTIYVGSSDSSLYAVNPAGTLEWRYVTGGVVRSSPAIADDGTVYVGSDDNSLYAIKPDGAFWWAYTTGGRVASSPAIAADGTVYFGSSDNYLYAANPDGTLKWRYLTGDSITSSPVVAADGTVYIGSNDKYLYALNPDSTLKWRFKAGAGISYASPAIGSDGTIYFGSNDNSFCALNPDGTTKWRYWTKASIRSSPAIARDGAIYIGSSDSFLYALDSDSTLKWRYVTGGHVRSTPVVGSHQTLCFGSDDSLLYALDRFGNLLWQFQTGAKIESSPTIGPDGTVYFTCYDGFLYAFKGTDTLEGTAWPKFHHDLRNSGRTSGGR